MERIETALEKVAGWGCGACGAPDCRTFAEDVVRGQAEMTDCQWQERGGPPPPGGPSGNEVGVGVKK